MILMRKSAFILNLIGQETEQGMVDQISVEQNDTAINLILRPAMTLQLKKGITSIIILSSGSAQILIRRVHSCILTDNQSG